MFKEQKVLGSLEELKRKEVYRECCRKKCFEVERKSFFEEILLFWNESKEENNLNEESSTLLLRKFTSGSLT